MEKKLSEFEIGETGTVVKVTSQGAVKRHLFDMGITPGTTITLKKFAPFGDPIQLSLRGYELSIRKCDAETVVMLCGGEKK